MKVRSLIKSTYYIVLNPSNTLLHIFADSSILKNWNKVPRWKWWPTKITYIKKLREPKQCSKRNGWMLFMTFTKIVKKRDSYHQKTEWHPFWGKELYKNLRNSQPNHKLWKHLQVLWQFFFILLQIIIGTVGADN